MEIRSSGGAPPRIETHGETQGEAREDEMERWLC